VFCVFVCSQKKRGEKKKGVKKKKKEEKGPKHNLRTVLPLLLLGGVELAVEAPELDADRLRIWDLVPRLHARDDLRAVQRAELDEGIALKERKRKRKGGKRAGKKGVRGKRKKSCISHFPFSQFRPHRLPAASP
jgi:hypothetical protein